MRSRTVLLDACVVGELVHPRGDVALAVWVAALLSRRTRVLVPEIADYELRRKLLHIGSLSSVERLARLEESAGYLPLTTAAMLRAAELWAEARRRGRPTAPDEALDADMILAAQASTCPPEFGDVVVATTNPKHLSLFVDARRWEEID